MTLPITPTPQYAPFDIYTEEGHFEHTNPIWVRWMEASRVNLSFVVDILTTGFPSGSPTNPSIFANGAPTTGIYWVTGTPSMGITVNGTSVGVFNSTGFTGNSATATRATNLAGGLAGSIPYQTGVNTTTMLAAGTGVLIGGAVPSYTTTPSLVGTNFSGTASSLTAGHVTTNANLTGPITSVGNATSVASQTGTGSTFVMNNTPTLITPVIGAATGNSLTVTGSLTSTVATGTPPLVVSSTTQVTNLNASSLGGATFSSPGSIGNTSASSGKFTTLEATGSFTPSTTAGIVGTTLADVANAGSIGELKDTGDISGVAITSSTTTNITTLSLTAGNWDVFGTVVYTPAGTTPTTTPYGALSTTSVTFPSASLLTTLPLSFLTGQVISFAVPYRNINVSTTTTIYLLGFITYSVSTLTAGGRIYAVRRR